MPINRLSADTRRLLGSSIAIPSAVAVVKELIDNSIDAGSSSISIYISPDTVQQIKVVDNGRGMERDDLDLLGQHGTTSKISSFEDLQKGVSTLGFRGNALASMCDVSDSVSITSKPMCSPSLAATGKLVSGGCGIRDPQNSPAPAGTTVKVEGLFSASPVRKKEAIKNSKKSLTSIKTTLLCYAMANPLIKFNLKVVGHVDFAFQYSPPPHSDIYGCQASDVIAQVLGHQFHQQLAGTRIKTVQIVSGHMKDRIKLKALFPCHECQASLLKSRGAYISVNGRPITSNGTGIVKRILDIFYKTLEGAPEAKQMVGSRPFMQLSISCPTWMYDVNIAPLKDEILFTQEEELLNAFQWICKAWAEHSDGPRGTLQRSPDRSAGSSPPILRRIKLTSSTRSTADSPAVESTSEGTMSRLQPSLPPWPCDGRLRGQPLKETVPNIADLVRNKSKPPHYARPTESSMRLSKGNQTTESSATPSCGPTTHVFDANPRNHPGGRPTSVSPRSSNQDFGDEDEDLNASIEAYLNRNAKPSDFATMSGEDSLGELTEGEIDAIEEWDTKLAIEEPKRAKMMKEVTDLQSQRTSLHAEMSGRGRPADTPHGAPPPQRTEPDIKEIEDAEMRMAVEASMKSHAEEAFRDLASPNESVLAESIDREIPADTLHQPPVFDEQMRELGDISKNMTKEASQGFKDRERMMDLTLKSAGILKDLQGTEATVPHETASSFRDLLLEWTNFHDGRAGTGASASQSPYTPSSDQPEQAQDPQHQIRVPEALMWNPRGKAERPSQAAPVPQRDPDRVRDPESRPGPDLEEKRSSSERITTHQTMIQSTFPAKTQSRPKESSRILGHEKETARPERTKAGNASSSKVTDYYKPQGSGEQPTLPEDPERGCSNPRSHHHTQAMLMRTPPPDPERTDNSAQSPKQEQSPTSMKKRSSSGTEEATSPPKRPRTVLPDAVRAADVNSEDTQDPRERLIQWKEMEELGRGPKRIRSLKLPLEKTPESDGTTGLEQTLDVSAEDLKSARGLLKVTDAYVNFQESERPLVGMKGLDAELESKLRVLGRRSVMGERRGRRSE